MDELKPYRGPERRSTRRDQAVHETPPEELRRRRLRDRLETDGGVLPSPALGVRAALRNALLSCDDDLRQAARSLEGIEAFLMRAARLLEKQDLSAEEIHALLAEDLAGQWGALGDTLGSLARELAAIARRL